jgi:hypothetical protein
MWGAVAVEHFNHPKPLADVLPYASFARCPIARRAIEFVTGTAKRRSVRHSVAPNAFLILLVAFALSACGEGYSYHYRLTLEVDDRGVKRTTSNVVEMHTTIFSGLSNLGSAGPQVQSRAIGEASVLELSDGGLLVVSLRAKDWASEGSKYKRLWSEDSPFATLQRAYGIAPPDRPKRNPGRDWLDPYRHVLTALKAQRGPRDIPFEQLPDLLTFADSSDPASVSILDPDDLSSTFGPGVRLLRATIEVTDQGKTRGIDQKLPWVRTIHRRVFSGKFSTDTGEARDNIDVGWLQSK